MKLSFFGDMSLYNIDHTNFHFCENLHQLLDHSDLNIGNLECPLTLYEDKDDSLPVTMNADSKALRILDKFDIFSLANNHIRDFKDQGITDTLDELKKTGFKYFGVGKIQKEALAPYIFEKEDFKLALIGATRYANTNGSTIGTGNDNSSHITRQIKQQKREGCFVAVFPHWGYEYVRIPSPRERKLARKWIDAGADIVIGSHPHIYQTIETYKGKTIVYSLGNFIFHSSVFDGLSYVQNDPRLNEGIAVSINIEKNYRYSISIHGFKTYDESVTLLSKKENDTLVEEISRISAIHKKSVWAYKKAFYLQTIEISEQNKKVRSNYQGYEKMSLIEKIMIYRNANIQDVKNRIAGLILSTLKIK
jgi:hypothetical protein